MVLCVLLVLVASVPNWAWAQGEPNRIVDAVFRDLSLRLGTPLDRSSANWTWEEKVFPDGSLGCPQPGAAYTQAQTKGYIIVIQPVNSATLYDYRVSFDGAVIILCSPALPALPAPQATPIPAPIAQPAASVGFNAPVMAFVGAGGNVQITSLSENPGPASLTLDSNVRYELGSPYPTANRDYGLFRWSPDGTRLLFVDTRTQQVFMAASGVGAQLVTSSTLILMPPAWSPDGQEIAYAAPTNQVAPNGIDQVYQIQAVTGPGAPPRVVGTIRYGVGCGGGGWPLSTVLYYADAGYEGNNLTLHWTPNGVVHSTNCTGVGLRLSDAGGNSIWEQPTVKRAVIALDGRRAVVVVQAAGAVSPQASGDTVAVLDLASGALTAIHIAPGVIERAAWTADGSQLIFTTRTLIRSVEGVAGSLMGQQFFVAWPGTFEIYQMTLMIMPAQPGVIPTPLAVFEAFGVGNISTSAASGYAVISVTGSDVPMVERLNAGGAQAEVAGLRPKVALYWVLLDPNAAQRTGLLTPDGSQPALSPGGAFTATSPASGGSSVPGNGGPGAPPALLIGGQAVVSVRPGDALNMRETPSTTAGVKRILQPGQVVTILAGPVVDAGLRWWQVRLEPTGEVGWVVDQVTENGVAENTLTPR
jgi:Tol biopolymer transport system component